MKKASSLTGCLRPAGSSARSSPDGSVAFDTRTAQILNSGILRDRIDRADRAVVRRAIERPVIRDEHRVGPNGLHDLRADDDRAAAALDADEIAVGDAERLGQARMDLAERLRVLVDERADAARLRARQILRHHASRRQHDRVVGVGLFGGGPPVGRLKVRLAVGMAELPAFVQARRAGMIERRARPEDAHLAIDALPGDAGVVGDAALRGDAQLLEDLARRL